MKSWEILTPIKLINYPSILFFYFKMVVDFIQSISCFTIEKRKNGHFSNKTIASLFCFATLVRARAVGLTETKNILIKCSHMSLLSSKIQANSKEQILLELLKSTNSAKLLSTMTLEKQLF